MLQWSSCRGEARLGRSRLFFRCWWILSAGRATVLLEPSGGCVCPQYWSGVKHPQLVTHGRRECVCDVKSWERNCEGLDVCCRNVRVFRCEAIAKPTVCGESCAQDVRSGRKSCLSSLWQRQTEREFPPTCRTHGVGRPAAFTLA